MRREKFLVPTINIDHLDPHSRNQTYRKIVHEQSDHIFGFTTYPLIGKKGQLFFSNSFVCLLAAVLLASSGSVFKGVDSGQKQPKTIPRIKYKSKIKIVKSHPVTYVKLPFKGVIDLGCVYLNIQTNTSIVLTYPRKEFLTWLFIELIFGILSLV